MSGIAGILRLDGCQVDPRDVAVLTAGIGHLGPERLGRWDGDGVSVVHALLAATPEATAEEQPLVDPMSNVAVVFDGRLDNREELLDATSRVDRRTSPPATDAGIVLRAYAAWGSAFVPRLLGDFAFAVWDGHQRRLLCGRDPLGVRPLLYRVAGRRLAWASAMKPLANLPGAPTRPNPGMVAEYLTNSIAARHETEYEGVYRLPPAHTLTVEGGSVRLARYWDVDPSREVLHGSHDQYAGHLREILTTAVRSRMRTIGPAVAELSGGLDSSTIVGIAQSLVGIDPSKPGDVCPLSLVYPGEACDESGWIDVVADHCGLEPIKLIPEPGGGFDFVEESRHTGAVPNFPVLHHWGRLYSQASDRGARSVLNGIGGDEWLTGTAWEVADLIRAGRFRSSMVRAGLAGRHDGTSTITALWRYGLRPALGDVLPASVPRRLRARRSIRRAGWIPAAFARSVGLSERLQLPTRANLRTLSQAQICDNLDSGELAAGCEATAAFMSRYELEPRMPFLDVRVIELALAVPEAERWGGDRPKRLLRSAARGLIPDSLFGRLDKPGHAHLMIQELLAPQLAPNLQFAILGNEGWVDGPRLRAIHARLVAESRSGGPVSTADLWPLWRAMAVELWLGAAFDT